MADVIFDGAAIDLKVSQTKYWGGSILADANGGFTTYSVNSVFRQGPSYVSTQIRTVDSVTYDLGPSTALAAHPPKRVDHIDMDRLAGGNLVMSWLEYSADVRSATTMFRIFDASGRPVTGTLPGNTAHQGSDEVGDILVTALSNGGFVTTWSEFRQGSHECFAQVFGADGVVSAPAFRLNPTLPMDQRVVALTALSQGQFMGIWTEEADSFSQTSLIGRVFSAGGVSVGKAFSIVAGEDGVTIGSIHAIALTNGDVAVSWREDSISSDGPVSFHAQIVHQNGKPAGAEFTVVTADGLQIDGHSLSNPSMVALHDGRWMMAWSAISDGESVMGRIYNADGSLSVDTIELATGRVQTDDVHLAVLADGRVAVYFNDGSVPNARPDAFVQIIDPRLAAITLTGSTLGDQFKGTIWGDTLAGGTGRDKIAGADGADLLSGGAQADTLLGGAGNDRLDGGLGDDLLTGGLNSDTFVFAAKGGHDTISDFKIGADLLNLHAYHFASASEALSHVTQTEAGAMFAIGSDWVLMQGVVAADLGAGSLVL